MAYCSFRTHILYLQQNQCSGKPWSTVASGCPCCSGRSRRATSAFQNYGLEQKKKAMEPTTRITSRECTSEVSSKNKHVKHDLYTLRALPSPAYSKTSQSFWMSAIKKGKWLTAATAEAMLFGHPACQSKQVSCSSTVATTHDNDTDAWVDCACQ